MSGLIVGVSPQSIPKRNPQLTLDMSLIHINEIRDRSISSGVLTTQSRSSVVSEELQMRRDSPYSAHSQVVSVGNEEESPAWSLVSAEYSDSSSPILSHFEDNDGKIDDRLEKKVGVTELLKTPSSSSADSKESQSKFLEISHDLSDARTSDSPPVSDKKRGELRSSISVLSQSPIYSLNHSFDPLNHQGLILFSIDPKRSTNISSGLDNLSLEEKLWLLTIPFSRDYQLVNTPTQIQHHYNIVKRDAQFVKKIRRRIKPIDNKIRNVVRSQLLFCGIFQINKEGSR